MIVCPRPLPSAAVRLFCFPYAGGGASCYRQVLASLPGDFELCGIELPGRQARLQDRHPTDFAMLVTEVDEAIRPWLDRPFAFFGHSMGGWMSYALACRLYEYREGPLPCALIVSGCRAPSVPFRPPLLHLTDDAGLYQRLMANGIDELGMPTELFELIKPAIRGDLALLETWSWPSLIRLSIPIHVFGGIDDKDVDFAALDGWRAMTSEAFTLDRLPGRHFFIHENPVLFSQLLCRRVLQIQTPSM
ncbi:thioesterase II family protein [Comamonas sp. GB3 AK4-5]|uniref:thioesterase II family protein n=1 Tax=Comamonas sp. GB3 AK4-5 TaxID=3231487 RepID=UPI00351ED83B